MTDEIPKALSSNVAAIDVYRAAKIVIDYYGDEAAIRAAIRSDTLLRLGDPEGAMVWKRIVEAIKAMQDIGSEKPLH